MNNEQQLNGKIDYRRKTAERTNQLTDAVDTPTTPRKWPTNKTHRSNTETGNETEQLSYTNIPESFPNCSTHKNCSKIS